MSSPIVSSVEIARGADEVFAYATDPARFGEWQAGVVEGRAEGSDPTRVGSRCTVTRRLGGRDRTSSSEVTEFDPPRRWAVRGVDGPIRADVGVTVEQLAEQRSRVTVRLVFHGHGMGKLIAPLVVRQARGEVPRSCARLRDLLEH